MFAAYEFAKKFVRTRSLKSTQPFNSTSTQTRIRSHRLCFRARVPLQPGYTASNLSEKGVHGTLPTWFPKPYQTTIPNSEFTSPFDSRSSMSQRLLSVASSSWRLTIQVRRTPLPNSHPSKAPNTTAYSISQSVVFFLHRSCLGGTNLFFVTVFTL